MLITLKMLIEKARAYYAAMESSRTYIPLLQGTGSKLYVFDQLIGQYGDDPKYAYKANQKDQTPDSVVAEIIDIDLKKGISPDFEIMKMQITDTLIAHSITNILQIISQCAQVAIGNLSAERAKQEIATLATIYQNNMGAYDKDSELINEATIFCEAIAVSAIDQKAKDEKDSQIIEDLSRQIDALKSQITTLNVERRAMEFRQNENTKKQAEQLQTLDDLQTQLSEQLEAAQHLEAACTDLTEEVGATQQLLDTSEIKVHELDSQLAAKEKEFVTKLGEKDRTLALKDKAIKALKDNLTSANTSNTRLLQSLTQATQQGTEYQAQLHILEQRVDERDTKITGLLAENEALRAQLADAEDEMKQRTKPTISSYATSPQLVFNKGRGKAAAKMQAHPLAVPVETPTNRPKT